jgi:hypothetical protein
MRRGELSCWAPRWEDVDLSVPQLRVRTGLAHVGGRFRLKSTKTGRGRVLHVDDDTAAAIAARPQREDGPWPLVFTAPDPTANRGGRRWSPTGGGGSGRGSTCRASFCSLRATATRVCCSTRACRSRSSPIRATRALDHRDGHGRLRARPARAGPRRIRRDRTGPSGCEAQPASDGMSRGQAPTAAWANVASRCAQPTSF